MLSDDVTGRLHELVTGGNAGLAGGAELFVQSAEGAGVFRAPLARHWRHEVGENCVWLRPILGGFEVPDRRVGEPRRRYSLNTARRRGLRYNRASIHAGEVVFELVTSELAIIRLVRQDLRAELNQWDDFVLGVLPADVEADLEELIDDSWHGEFA